MLGVLIIRMVMVVIIHDCFSVIMMLLVLLYIIHNYIHIIRLLLDLYRHWLVAEGHGFSLEFFSWFYVFSFLISECKFLIQKLFYKIRSKMKNLKLIPCVKKLILSILESTMHEAMIKVEIKQWSLISCLIYQA